MKKIQKKARTLSAISLAVFVLATIVMVFALSRTVAEVREVAISREPEALLASAGLKDAKDVSLQVSYFDQTADECVDIYDKTKSRMLEERQFGWRKCGYYNQQLEQGIVDYDLGNDYLPIAVGGNLIPNRGLTDLSRWYSEIEGKSKEYTGIIKLDYNAEDATFSFYQNDFYPLDDAEYDKTEIVNNDGHNHLFTMRFMVPFTALLSGNESFSITADDDTFVFVGDKLVLDMGGIHDATTGSFVVRENGEIYTAIEDVDYAYSGLNVSSNEGSVVRIYHADRDEKNSVFKVRFAGMNLGVVDAKLADGGKDGVQIAYDPNDPSYVAPLGESAVVKPDTTRGYMILVTMEGAVVVVLAVFVALSARLLIKRAR